jgi:hypothetical protein
MFVGVHAMLALQLKTPELEVSEIEAREFAKAAQNVMRHYSVQATQKTIDWISFAGITAGIYGTRALAISNRRKEERRGGHGERGQVLKFRPRGGGAPQAVHAEPPHTDPPQPADYVPTVMPEDVPDFEGF